MPTSGDDSQISEPDPIGDLVRFDEQLTRLNDSSARESPSLIDAASDASLRAAVRLVHRLSDLQLAAKADPASDLPARFGKFEIAQKLGHGGYGVVYLACDTEYGRMVALKIPTEHCLERPELRQRFFREVQSIARLEHPNIVQMLEAGDIDGRPYLSMSYCSGPTLAEWLSRQSIHVPIRLAAELVRDLANGVEHAHRKGILHRDIKPSNVIWSTPQVPGCAPNDAAQDNSGKREPAVVRLADFGLAKWLDDGGSLTRSQAQLGTLRYMSPEQAEGRASEIGPSSDVYALGAILYELVTARPPFSRDANMATLRQIVEMEPTPPRSLRLDVPRDIETVILKCLAKQPAWRYASAGDLADELSRFLRGQPIAARATTTLERTAKWASRKPAQAALVVVSVIAVGTILATSLALNSRLSHALQRALDNEQVANEKTREAFEHLYATEMAIAHQAWQDGDIASFEGHLQRFAPSKDQPDLRGFEWYYQRNLLKRASLVLRGHERRIGALAFSTDGRWLASGANEELLRIWQADSGALERTIEAPKAGEINGVDWSPDGGAIAAACDDKSIRIWSTADGRELARLIGHSEWVADVGFSPKGDQITSADGAGKVFIWKWRTKDRPLVLSGHTDIVRAAKFLLDGSMVVSVGQDHSTRFWRVTDGSSKVYWTKIPRNHTVRPSSMSVSRSRDRMAVCWENFAIESWHIDATGKATKDGRQKHDSCRCVSLSDDGTQMDVGTNHSLVETWENNAAIPKTRRGHRREVIAIARSPNNAILASADRGGELRIFGHSEPLQTRLLANFPFGIRSLLLSADGKELIVAGFLGEVDPIDATSGAPTPFAKRPLASSMQQLAMSPSGNLMAGKSQTGKLEVWRRNGKTPEGVLPTGEWKDAIFCVDERRLFYYDVDRVVKLEWASNRTEGQFASRVRICQMRLSPDGRMLAIGDDAGSVVVLDATDLQVLTRLSGHTQTITGIAFSPDSRFLLTASDDRSTRLWTIADGDSRAFQSAGGTASRLEFHPDGKTAFAAATDKLIAWNVRTGRKLFDIGEIGRVNCLAISRDGLRLFVGSLFERGLWVVHVLEAPRNETP